MLKFEDLTEEQKAKALACETPEDMLALAKEEGFEISDEELEAIAGGGIDWGGCHGKCFFVECQHGCAVGAARDSDDSNLFV